MWIYAHDFCRCGLALWEKLSGDELASKPRRSHSVVMTVAAKKSVRTQPSIKFERTVVYRGIKIAPISGKRSATSRAIRDALQTKVERVRGDESARG
jgi:hypothetical protein